MVQGLRGSGLIVLVCTLTILAWCYSLLQLLTDRASTRCEHMHHQDVTLFGIRPARDVAMSGHVRERRVLHQYHGGSHESVPLHRRRHCAANFAGGFVHACGSASQVRKLDFRLPPQGHFHWRALHQRSVLRWAIPFLDLQLSPAEWHEVAQPFNVCLGHNRSLFWQCLRHSSWLAISVFVSVSVSVSLSLSHGLSLSFSLTLSLTKSCRGCEDQH